MSWLVEWKQWNEQEQDYVLCSDAWDKWEDAVRIFNDCISDSLCCGATVYCFMGGEPYNAGEDDNIVLKYCP